MKNIPNILSGLRILLIPVFTLLIVQDQLLAGAGVLFLSGVTDLLDGYLARRFGWISALGKVLDPAADKLTQITLCVLMVIHLRRYWPFFAALLVKEAIMLLLGGALYKKGVQNKGANLLGKAATFAFYVTVLAILVFPALPEPLKLALLVLVVLLSYGAGISYLPQYLQARKTTKD